MNICRDLSLEALRPSDSVSMVSSGLQACRESATLTCGSDTGERTYLYSAIVSVPLNVRHCLRYRGWIKVDAVSKA